MTPLTRPYNFAAGPATLPQAVLEQAAAELLDWQGRGVSVMEMSHRSEAFEGILADCEARLRRVLAVPSDFAVLFMQGGAQAQNALVPLNLARARPVAVAVTGLWSAKSLAEAARYTNACACADTRPACTQWPSPAGWALPAGAAYVQICANETVHGVEAPLHAWPDLAALGSDAALVVDASSNILTHSVPWPRVGLLYACAQKNLGIAGLTLVFVRRSLLGQAAPACPTVFNYTDAAANRSMTNTPPTYAIYLAGLTLAWLEREGGLAQMAERAQARSSTVYAAIDTSGGFYRSAVEPGARSRINVPFTLATPELTTRFLDAATAAGLLNLKGHKAVGGVRASLYNAMPLAGAQALVAHMQQFARSHG